MSDWYTPSGSPSTGSAAASSPIRSEFSSISAGFDKLPNLNATTANGFIQVNSGGTALTAVNNSTARTNLGLGTIATQQANNVAITGGTLTGLTSLGTNNVSITGGSATSVSPLTSNNVVATGGSMTGMSNLNSTAASFNSVLIGKNATNFSVAGTSITNSGVIDLTTDGARSIEINRLNSDGTLEEFYRDGSLQGSISVLTGTVSYNAFLGSHWSQLESGERVDILQGTLLSTIDQMCAWPDETNEKLPRCKVSDSAGDERVYGVFLGWDNDDLRTNDLYVAAVGQYLVRMQKGQALKCGYVESAGDGTARFQSSSAPTRATVAEVNCAVAVRSYPDGSFLMPAKLMKG